MIHLNILMSHSRETFRLQLCPQQGAAVVRYISLAGLCAQVKWSSGQAGMFFDFLKKTTALASYIQLTRQFIFQTSGISFTPGFTKLSYLTIPIVNNITISKESLLHSFVKISGFQSFSSDVSRGKHSWCNILALLRLLTVCLWHSCEVSVLKCWLEFHSSLCHSSAAIQCTEDTGVKI